ncbi:GNAT family N-acetyltransferase [Halobacillus sp. Marseille-P3879]|uniref:GNAT family N-acetyltransferase n=1 Tax=Halobacillus sp. Marseille-P3879 TaxID=2045014 RepID=UPI000C7D98CF|nr:GNAT family N-acetyltransferase [Halobacillus sp. Marseille-P3879]
MVIREIKNSDAENLASLTYQVENSSQYMLWEAGERVNQAENYLKLIERIRREINSVILVAEKENQLVGYVCAFGGSAKRNKHSAYIVIGILKGFRGQGLGSKLFNELEHWAKHHNIRRLELTVVTENEPALSLYKNKGFKIEGAKRKALYIESEFVDEYYMSKLL